MVQIIEENRRPSFSQSIVGGLAQGIPGAIEKYQNRSALSKEGINPNLPSEFQKLAYQNRSKLQQEEAKAGHKADLLKGKYQQEREDKLAPLIGAKSSIDRMRQLREKGNLGRGSSLTGFFGGETAKERGEYATLGNSLIQFASSIPIRNRQEFEKLAGHIGDPSITDSEAEGILNALEKMIGDSVSKYESEDAINLKEEAHPGLEELDADSAAEHKGRTVEDDRGNRYRSNGSKWVKI